MKKVVFTTLILMYFTSVSFGQDEDYERIYGGKPTANENMEWKDDVTPNEQYIGVIWVDSSVSATKIIQAFMATYQPIQDANIMTRQMRNNSAFGGVASAMSGDMESMEEFSKAGDADSRRGFQGQSSWSVQFIDGVRINRFYYNVNVQARKGRYKLIVTPSGLSGYANDHIQTEWSQLFKKGKVRSFYSNYHPQMKTKLAFTIDQWISKVDKHISDSENDDW